MKKFSERGDTLIEVLLSLAVIGMVLGVAYGAASRSTRVGRLAQERTEALKHAEAQIERMKAMSTRTNSGGLFTEPPDNDSFCVNPGLSKVVSSDAACRVGFYSIANSYDTTSDIVSVSITWEQQGGNSGGTSPEVRMLYKLFR